MDIEDSKNTNNNQQKPQKRGLFLGLIGLSVILAITLGVFMYLYINEWSQKQCLIDTHAHAWSGEWMVPPPRRYTPPHGNTLDKYMGQLWGNNFQYGVLVQPSFLGSNNTEIEQALEKYENLRGVAVIDPMTISITELNRLNKMGFRGIRLNLKGADMEEFYKNGDSYKSAFKWMKDNDWHVEAQQVSENWVQLIDWLVKSGCRVVVDHFSRPDKKLGLQDPGFQAVLKAGKEHDNIWIKCSAMYRIGGGTDEGNALVKQYADEVLKHFGIKRILWGSDYPYVNNEINFQDSQDFGQLYAEFQKWFPESSQQKQVQKNAMELFNIDC